MKLLKLLGGIFLFLSLISFSFAENKALVLQEMTWTDIQEYLKNNDMVIIPLGSTEQHGPHLPLGSDFFEAFEISKLISSRTGVVVAPILMVGYSEYHSGFPGTLSVKPQTMEQVIFECVEMLIKYGFRRILFFNYHGGNNIVQENVIHRINHNTPAIAVSIGHGSPIQKAENGEFFDWHGGLNETSIMLYLKPKLVKMERAKKPEIHFTPQMKKLRELAKENPDIIYVWNSLFGVPEKTGKGGASYELSSNGIWSLSDPRLATRERGIEKVHKMVEKAVKFIETWKKVK
ncbi:creatininase family protein [SCandidatus Aminicenantes bacterium Aminicenantia_JdfR_composite]|jgi:creatinine amidohydrolase|nr:creatininase family protein [SCandidatus Aminicenantes bacterium Aminicenantia_JdfR_composite]MCP2596841.1 creatininase family protein [Candidatus Aminicenantes bacterium AC-335-G13]MCP2605547.1 creatininase family protein [Candidatus Aminicenantes bacterium AC-335-O07]